MKHCIVNTIIKPSLIIVIFLKSNFLFSDLLLFENEKVRLNLTGQLSDQMFVSDNIQILNARVADDQINYILTTLDWFFKADFGAANKTARTSFFTDLRFQFAWGSYAEAMIKTAYTDIAGVRMKVNPSRFDKHLLWMRESWMKIMLGGDPETKKHFLQIGLIPFYLGRAISLGAAYETVGFLGFTPTYNIEQYAPGIVLGINSSRDNFVNIYLAILENEQDSLENIFEPIRTMELNSCTRRGIGVISYLAAIQNKLSFTTHHGCNYSIEPYLLFLSAPDKTLEFANDLDSELSTAGIAVEGNFKSFNWGFECAKNFGSVFVKPLDRNQIRNVLQDDGTIIQQYTKVYTNNPALPERNRAIATEENSLCVNSSFENVFQNGQEICPGLWNAFDRFRPAQKINLDGYYCIADVAFDYIPNVLQGAFGVGYFSGSDRVRVDFNKASNGICMNQTFSGFVPLQSNYSGKRIRHFVMLNQGVPRYTIATPQQDFSPLNATNPISTDTLDATTNLVFIGTRAAFFPVKFKNKKMLCAPNIIGYWAANTSYVSDEDLPPDSPFLKNIDNYLGTEINLEFSFDIFERLRFTGYMGVLFPGGYYKDIAGTVVKAYNLPIGCDPCWIANFAIAYTF